jgi:phosphatidyl-myo-inositol dimannoside synthase|uniref:glycosyltransferase family 4 protein n=1 Tax=Candidatus Planktophila sp. TaxID=2175601 RepID=UPI00404AE999
MSELALGKILCITNDFGPRAGGIETFVMGLIERAPQGSIIVYTSAQGDTTSYDQAWLRDFGVEVIRDRSKILLPTPRVIQSVKKVIARDSIKQVFFGAAAPLAVMARSLRRKGVVNIVALTHGHEVWWAKLWPFSSAISSIGNSVDHLTYLGEFTKSEIAKALSTKAKSRLVKIAPGIDTDHFAPDSGSIQLRRELGLIDKKVIVSVGRLVHRKGQDFLIQSLPAILEKHPTAHILMVGEGPYRKDLTKMVEKLKLSQSVTFIGRIQYKDLPRYICAGDIFAMPSRSRLAGLEVEGLGIVYLEASSCALPVVAGRSGGAPDAVDEGITGFSVDGTSTAEISSAIIKLLDDPVKAKAMGAAGRSWIIEKWRWEIWSKQFNALFR